MTDITTSDVIAIGSLVVATATGLSAITLWYANNEKRKYGLERDFGHLKRSYEQIQDSLNLILKEIDYRFDTSERDILEIKSILGIKK